jgi:23S rRNA pseudouridine2605 synthase
MPRHGSTKAAPPTNRARDVPPERLQKVLAAAGVASRRGSEALIAAGRVTVDGVVASVGQSVDPSLVRIAVDGRPLRAEAPHRYLALHKPAGVTSTVRDRHAERTVIDLVPRELAGGRLYPVGRLDLDSEGLLLLTNDGAWADQVLHPRNGVDREYAIALAAPLSPEQRHALARGIELEEGTALVEHLRPATLTETRRLAALLAPPPSPRLTWYRGTLRQGWKRQLRRMFAAVDAPVQRLIRVRVGTLRIDDLPSGEVRELTAADAHRLVGTAKMSS